jgi:hypothetical protein
MKMMETKELHINIEHKIRLELEIASMKELVLGLLKEKKGSYETMHRNYTISSIFAITPLRSIPPIQASNVVVYGKFSKVKNF